MAKFKVGDRVRIKSLGPYSESRDSGLFVGNAGTVVEAIDPVDVALVALDGDYTDDSWPFYDDEIELAQGGAA